MTWLYDSNLSTPKDQVRFETGDTIQLDPLLQDEEIEFVLSQNSNQVLRAAAECCEKISALFARQVDNNSGKTSAQASQRSKAYATLARRLRNRFIVSSVPSAGGTDGDLAFDKGMMDNT